jgi:transcriptional regulator with GAF, ATPase, and Fis domain
MIHGDMTAVLLAWIGQTDLDCANGDKPGRGPIGSVVAARSFDALVLLSNYTPARNRVFVDRLAAMEAPPVHLRLEALDDPTDYGAIHAAAVRALDYARETFGADADLSIHVSPGTPAMQAVWVLLAKTRYPAELIQSHARTGVRTVSVPFDIAAEYVPALLRDADDKLARLTAGLPAASPAFDRMIGRSPAMDRARTRARRIAPHDVTVLIEGESGTGKELFARAIHAESRRRRGPFEEVNCGALPEGLVESLLFGHVRGAFSGAVRPHAGHFEVAGGGTLFLDEIGELPLPAQVKLLRALQEKTVRRLGSDKPVAVDVRIVAATNRDLRAEVAAGRFREDLYYRLATGVIRLPPLRERQGDLTPLIDHFLAAANRKFADQPGVEQKALSPPARNLLLRHPWPGNVRELQATIDRIVLWAPNVTVSAEDVRHELLGTVRDGGADLLGRPLGDGLALPSLVADLARHYLERALTEADGNKTRAAGLIGLPSYQTLTNWMKRYDVALPDRARRR